MLWLAACSWLEFTKCRLEVVYWRLKSFRYEKMTDFMIFYKNKGGRLQSHSDWRPMTPSWGQPRLHTELSYCCLLANEVRWNICHFSFRLFIGRTDAEAETPILWPLDVKTWLFGKHSDAGKDWRQEEKGTTEDKMVGWHHWLNGHGFEQTQGDSEGQGGLACCSPWGHKESDTTDRLNNMPKSSCWHHLLLLASSNSLCLPHNRPTNSRDKGLKQGRDLNMRVSWPRRCQAGASK